MRQADLLKTIEESGFQATVLGKGVLADCDSAFLRVSGMTCSSCSSAVETAILGQKGVQVLISSHSCKECH